MPARKTDHVGSYGFKITRGLAKRVPGGHLHTDVEWNYLLRGSLRYFLGGRFYTVSPGQLVVFWAGIPHEVVGIETPCECIWVTIPIAWFVQWPMLEDFTKRLVGGAFICEPKPKNRRDDLLLAKWAEDFNPNSPELHRILLLEVEARLRRLAWETRAPVTGQALRHAPITKLEQVTSFVGAHYREELTIAMIAEHTHLHPNYLMQLFKRSCGMSLWDYVQRLRVSHAQRMLLMTSSKILDVALESGFASVSRFYAAFRRISGQTPRAYRQGGIK